MNRWLFALAGLYLGIGLVAFLLRPPRGQVACFHADNRVSCIAFSPTGDLLAAGGYGCCGAPYPVQAWSLKTGKEIRRFDGHMDCLSSVSFAPDGRFLLTASWDTTGRLWDVRTGEELRRFPHDEHTGRVFTSAMSPDGQWVLPSGRDQDRLWSLSTGREERRWDQRGPSIFSPDGRLALVGLSLLETRTWTVVRHLEAVDRSELAVVFSPDCRQVLGCNGSGMYLWDVESGKIVRSFSGLADEFICMAISPDGHHALSGAGSHSPGLGRDVACSVRLWSLKDGQEACRFQGHSHDVRSVAFSPDGSLAASGGDTTVRVWKLPPSQAVD